MVHHGDAGSQYTSLTLSEALTDAGIAGSIGSVGDALGNALMELTIGLFKTELIHRQRSWTGRAEVERGDRFLDLLVQHHRLRSSIGHLPPVEFEQHHHDTMTEAASIPELA